MTDKKPFQFKFFLPNARVLSDTEIENLSADKIKAERAGYSEGLWLEISCEDRSCLDEEGRLRLPTRESEGTKGKGFFLELFCPEGSCKVSESTDLP
jgi:hypothetical protein